MRGVNYLLSAEKFIGLRVKQSALFSSLLWESKIKVSRLAKIWRLDL